MRGNVDIVWEGVLDRGVMRGLLLIATLLMFPVKGSCSTGSVVIGSPEVGLIAFLYLILLFPDGVVGQFIRLRDLSDHCPIWLIMDGADWGLKPFKFNNE